MHGYSAFYPKPDHLNTLEILVFSGGTGVILFFILSGLLVTKPFIQKFVLKDLYSVREHATQRILRIVPLYYVWLIIAVIITGNYNKVLAALIFQSSGMDFGFYSAVWWSLGIEVQFYIAVPLIFYIGYHLGSIYLYLSLFIIATFYAIWAYGIFSNWPEAHYYIDNTFIGKFPAFAAGITCALIMPIIQVRRRLLFWLTILFAPVLMGVLFLALEHRAYNTNFLEEANNPQWPLLESISWAGLVLLWGSSGYSLFGYIGGFLSKVSYSLYLSHVPIIIFFALLYTHGEIAFLGPHGSLGLAIGSSLLISWITFHLIESPFLRLKDRLRKDDNPLESRR